jgi:hypothetical protein
MLRPDTEVTGIAYQLINDTFTFITPLSFQHSMTRVHAKLLGPCFKTGRIDDRLLHRKRASEPAPTTYPTNRGVRMRPPPTARQTAGRLVGHAHCNQYTTNSLSPARDTRPKGALKAELPTAEVYSSAHSTCKCTTAIHTQQVNQPKAGPVNQRVQKTTAEYRLDTSALSVSILSVSRPL